MVEFLAPAGDQPVSGMLLVTGEGTYRENAADANGVMQSNVQRRAEVEIAFRWGTGYERTVECFTNTIRNVHGGTHRKGFERALVRALADAVRNTRGLLKPKEDPPILDDVLEGMTAVMHVRIPEPQFTSQTKDELSTAGITRVLQALVEQHLKAWVDGPAHQGRGAHGAAEDRRRGPGAADPEAAEGRRPAQDRPRGRVDAAETGRLPRHRRRPQSSCSSSRATALWVLYR